MSLQNNLYNIGWANYFIIHMHDITVSPLHGK